jgi:hypothetical protein
MRRRRTEQYVFTHALEARHARPAHYTVETRRDDRRGGDEETDGFPRRTYEASLDLDHQLDDARRRAPNWQTVLWEFREPFAAACARLGPVSTLRWIVWREGE